MSRWHRVLLASLLTGLFLLSGPVLANLTLHAEIDTREVALGDSLRLTVSVNENAGGRSPDVSELSKEFRILSSATSNRMRLINNRISAETDWIYTIAPTKTGYVVIPPVHYAGQSTKPLTIKVNERPTANAPNAGDQLVFVEAVVDKDSVYVQEQFVFTFRLYRRTQLIDTQISAFHIDHAAFERLGEQREYQTLLNGQRFNVIEVKYAVFPQRSGPLTVPSIEFAATIATGGRGLFFDPLGSGRQIRRMTDELSIDVKPRPASYPDTAAWLPARSLALTETWSQDNNQLTVGEPITRTLRMEATGLTPTALPALNVPDGNDFRVYPDQPATESRVGPDGLISTRTESYALIPTQPGEFTLPAQTVYWWNTQAQQVEKAELPARVFNVMPAASQPDITPPQPLAAPSTTPGTVSEDTDSGLAAVKTWQWLALAFALIWLLTMVALIRALRARRQPVDTGKEKLVARQFDTQPTPPSAKESKQQLKQACQANQPHEAAQAILHWHNALPDRTRAHSLGQLATQYGSPAVNSAIRTLEAALYRPASDTQWDGQAFWSAVEQLDKPDSHQTLPRAQLAPLYPESTTL